MVRHPQPSIIAKQLRHLADTLDDEGTRAIQRAAILAARGYPSSTAGTGVNGGGTSSTSTERAAGVDGDGKDNDPKLNLTPPMFAGLDERLAKLLRLTWSTALSVEEMIGDINSHADDSDPVPVGTGPCMACGLFCRPTGKRPGFRRRAGLCPADHTAWLRWRRQHAESTIDQFIHARWLEHNPDATTDQYLAWRQKMIEAENPKPNTAA